VTTGETILVTERDEVIAELRPKQGWSWKVRGLGLAPGSAAALLDQVRADRD
jgi:hypothetical protein